MAPFSFEEKNSQDKEVQGTSRKESVEVQLGVYIDVRLLSEFPEELARKYGVVPLQRLGKGLLVGSLVKPAKHRLVELSERLNAPVAAIPCHINDLEAIFETIFRFLGSSIFK